jgi:hypothetical protein
VSYTVVDVKGLFIDAVARGMPKDGEILGYSWDELGSSIRAIIRNRKTGAAAMYEMDLETGEPHEIMSVRIKQRARRPKLSREFKIVRAERLWEER